MRVVGFRAVDEDVWEEFKVYVLRKYGKLHGALAREVTRALREYLERHAGAASEAAPKGPEPLCEPPRDLREAEPAKPAAAQAPEGVGAVGGGEILGTLLKEARRDCFQGVGRVNLADLAGRLGCQPEQILSALRGSGLEWRLDPSGRAILIRL
ncbi:MAG: hypothetical protein QXO15_04375 [Nitrososphaerota archaeon]